MTSEKMTPMELVKVERFDNGCVVGLSVEMSKFGLVFFFFPSCFVLSVVNIIYVRGLGIFGRHSHSFACRRKM